MPCYDKKLEAVRPNFTLHEDVGQSNPDQEIKEVDTVLATHEIPELVQKVNNDFKLIPHHQYVKDEMDMRGSPSGWGFMELMEQFVDASISVEKFH